MGKGWCKNKKALGNKKIRLIALMLAVVVLAVALLLTRGCWDESQGQNETTVPGDLVSTNPSNGTVQWPEADYEKWLAASMVVGLSMEYPDFELTGIYTASQTSVQDKKDSEGVYIFFTSGGVPMALHSVALEAERTAKETKDISAQTVGWATFDLVDPATVTTESMTQIDLEELTELISLSLRISIYGH